MPRISICSLLLKILMSKNLWKLFGLGFQFYSWLFDTSLSHIPMLKKTLEFYDLNGVGESINFWKIASDLWIVQITCRT